MAIKPILFNTDMVRAILDGRKSCTRRAVKYKYSNTEMKIKSDKYGSGLIEIQKDVEGETYGKNPDGSTWHKLLPYIEKIPPYKKGDILYVRETWYKGLERYLYRADYSDTEKFYRGGREIKIKWHPSIHMPKEAARIWLKVTDVRMERLQDITEDGAKAEGMPDSFDYPVDKAYCPLCKGEGIIGTVDVYSLGHMDVDCPHCDSYRKRFENLWNSINQKCLDYYGWDANPYVWVISFERCEPPEDE